MNGGALTEVPFFDTPPPPATSAGTRWVISLHDTDGTSDLVAGSGDGGVQLSLGRFVHRGLQISGVCVNQLW